MKKENLKLGFAFMLMAALSACGNNDASSNENQSNSGETIEKTVNVYMPSPAGLQTALEKGFEAAYPGVDMKVTSGTTGELLAKIEAEKTNPICDVLILASWSDGINSLSKLDLMEYTPVNGDKLATPFKHSSNKIWGTSASAVGVLYNTDKVKKEEIEKLDWTDFANKDKVNGTLKETGEAAISIPDPTKSGACKDFLAGYVSSKGESAWTDFNGWAGAGLKNGGGNKPALAAVESGSVDILVAGVDYNAYADKKKDKPIDIYYPKGGTVVNARPAMIMNTATHKNAAKKVMDYLCSDGAQKLVADAFLLPGREDVSADSSRLGYSQIKQFENLNWDNMAANGTEIAKNFVDLLK